LDQKGSKQKEREKEEQEINMMTSLGVEMKGDDGEKVVEGKGSKTNSPKIIMSQNTCRFL